MPNLIIDVVLGPGYETARKNLADLLQGKVTEAAGAGAGVAGAAPPSTIALQGTAIQRASQAAGVPTAVEIQDAVRSSTAASRAGHEQMQRQAADAASQARLQQEQAREDERAFLAGRARDDEVTRSQAILENEIYNKRLSRERGRWEIDAAADAGSKLAAVRQKISRDDLRSSLADAREDNKKLTRVYDERPVKSARESAAVFLEKEAEELQKSNIKFRDALDSNRRLSEQFYDRRAKSAKDSARVFIEAEEQITNAISRPSAAGPSGTRQQGLIGRATAVGAFRQFITAAMPDLNLGGTLGVAALGAATGNLTALAPIIPLIAGAELAATGFEAARRRREAEVEFLTQSARAGRMPMGAYAAANVPMGTRLESYRREPGIEGLGSLITDIFTGGWIGHSRFAAQSLRAGGNLSTLGIDDRSIQNITGLLRQAAPTMGGDYGALAAGVAEQAGQLPTGFRRRAAELLAERIRAISLKMPSSSETFLREEVNVETKATRFLIEQGERWADLANKQGKALSVMQINQAADSAQRKVYDAAEIQSGEAKLRLLQAPQEVRRQNLAISKRVADAELAQVDLSIRQYKEKADTMQDVADLSKAQFEAEYATILNLALEEGQPRAMAELNALKETAQFRQKMADDQRAADAVRTQQRAAEGNRPGQRAAIEMERQARDEIIESNRVLQERENLLQKLSAAGGAARALTGAAFGKGITAEFADIAISRKELEARIAFVRSFNEPAAEILSFQRAGLRARVTEAMIGLGAQVRAGETPLSTEAERLRQRERDERRAERYRMWVSENLERGGYNDPNIQRAAEALAGGRWPADREGLRPSSRGLPGLPTIGRLPTVGDLPRMGPGPIYPRGYDPRFNAPKPDVVSGGQPSGGKGEPEQKLKLEDESLISALNNLASVVASAASGGTNVSSPSGNATTSLSYY